MSACVYIFEYRRRRRSCQWLVSSAARPSIRQGLSSFPTVHWPWVPGIDFLWCRAERGRYHMAPAMRCDQERILEIPMQWWWIASLWGPSILTYRNQCDTCTEFIIIQATDMEKTWMQCYGVTQTFSQVSTNTHLFIPGRPFAIYDVLAIWVRSKFRLLISR